MNRHLLWLLLIAIGIGIFLMVGNEKEKYIKADDQAIQEAISKKIPDKVFCSSDNPSKCFLYRCNSGYIYAKRLPAPGPNPLRCTDGSEIEELYEIPPEAAI